MTKEEIKITLWSLKAFKALEPDRLHVGFFQHFWPFVGNSVVKKVKKIFRERTMLEILNQTHIALIPKIQGSKSLGNYLLISLCNTIYNILMKIIVAKLRPYLGKLISTL